MSRIRCAILDVDGTLVDSNDAHTFAYLDAFAEFGHEVRFQQVRPLIGMGGDKVLRDLIGLDEDDPKAKALTERRGIIFRENYLPRIRPFPSSRALLERMRRAGLKLVVASSAKEEELGGLLGAAGVTDLIERHATSDDAENSKPDPDIVQAALMKSGFPAREAMMLGDTPYDIEAARRCNLDTVALLCGGWHRQDLAGAAAIFRDPADLLARFDDSPFLR